VAHACKACVPPKLLNVVKSMKEKKKIELAAKNHVDITKS
jgi:hypothetical protein